MFEKCINCGRLGESCVPNTTLLSFAELIQWCDKRQKQRGWTNQTLSEQSKVPIGTINRIKAGDYLDCRYSTIRNLLIALIGGTTDEFPCNALVEKELAQMEALEKQVERLSALERENEALKAHLGQCQDLIAFLKDEVTAWRSWNQK